MSTNNFLRYPTVAKVMVSTAFLCSWVFLVVASQECTQNSLWYSGLYMTFQMIYLLIFVLYCIQTHLLWWTLQKSFKRTGKWRQCEVMCSFNQLLKTYGRLIVIDSPELSGRPRTKRERKEKALQIIFLTNNLVKDFKSAFSNKGRHKRKYNEWHLIMWPKLFYTCQWFSKAISTVSLPLSLWPKIISHTTEPSALEPEMIIYSSHKAIRTMLPKEKTLAAFLSSAQPQPCVLSFPPSLNDKVNPPGNPLRGAPTPILTPRAPKQTNKRAHLHGVKV